MLQISSQGGPLVLMQRSSLKSWHGVDSPGFVRACGIHDFAGVIEVDSKIALVFGDEPCHICFASQHPLGPLFIRWQWGEGEFNLSRILTELALQHLLQPDEVIDFQIEEAELILFDSISYGLRAEGLGLQVSTGLYRLTTKCVGLTQGPPLIVHRLLKAQDSTAFLLNNNK